MTFHFSHENKEKNQMQIIFKTEFFISVIHLSQVTLSFISEKKKLITLEQKISIETDWNHIDYLQLVPYPLIDHI